MHWISAEGTKFIYLLGPEDPEQVTASGVIVPMPEPSILALLRGLRDVRVVVFESMLRHGRGHIYYLFWRDCPDLSLIDKRVLDGSYSDADFETSVKTVHQETWCDQCGTRWHTLVIPPGDPYPNAPGLLEKKVAASTFERCPACGLPFRQMAVKVLGPANQDSH